MIITGEMIISGFVSKVVNEIVDVPLNPIKNAIRNADKNRKGKNQSIETRIYQVTIDALNEFTKNKFKGSDVLYDVAESIIEGFKTSKNSSPEVVGIGLKMLVSQVTSDTCQDFLRVLCYEICKEENRDLAIEVIILQQEQTKENVQKGFSRCDLNYEEINGKLDYLIKELVNKKVNEERNDSKNPIVNRAEEYAQKWDKNVFLNNFNKRDKKAGINIKLSQLYLDKHLPHYVWGTNDDEASDIEELLREHTVDNDDKKMLLILGQPGIGKSTLITWIMANLVQRKDDIYVYQFASDLKDIDWQGDNILKNIFKTINLKDSELENKVLIIDGFDEIHTSGGRERILNQIYHKLYEMKDLKKISLIITCRKNYISELQRLRCDYITLQALDEKQISSFCENYGNVSKKVIPQNTINHLISNKEILGIPLILYMVLALDIFIGEENSIGDIYDKIFSVNGGIYDRCINNMSYGEEHRISKAKEKIHQISQRIAFWMFENEPNEAVITNDKYEEICDNVIAEANVDVKRDVLISNYFEPIKHCEGIGTDELQFVHRSIYEYFVSVYFYESIYKLTSKIEVAGKLGELLKDGQLSKQILTFLKYRFDGIKRYNASNITREVFNIMLEDGMTYHRGVPCENALKREKNIFSNMLELVGVWNLSLGEFANDNIIIYLQCNRKDSLCLRGVNLSRKDLNGVDLRGADLRGANLRGTNLRGANLSGADLNGTDLFEANLNGANLSETNLNEANIREADLRGADLRGADLREADLRGADLNEANIRGANLNGADLNRANLIEANLKEANLIKVNLSEANLNEAKLNAANIREANIRGANLNRADLREANLREANLREASIRETNLNEANLGATNLIEANLNGANIREANLREANLNETIFDESQVNLLYKKYDFSDSKVYIFKTGEIISYKEYCTRE